MWRFGLAAIALLATGQAHATVYDISVTGKVVGGYDYAGLFGAAFSSLDGADFVASITFDDQTPGSGPLHYPDIIQGYGASDPVSTRLSINGKTFVFPQNYGIGSLYRPGYSFSEYQTVGDHLENYLILSFNYVGGLMPSAPLPGESFTVAMGSKFYPPHGVISQQAGFRIETSNPGRYIGANLDPKFLTIAARAALPEPATWAMMIAGFGAVGFSMRRRATHASGRRPRHR